ncbi:serine hydrolase [uncultured Umboniibacter sp.]|uniref:serine hydrolase domain-containing protein n=1 Tax=uncultured Umboniibacter sp. TaxID=1798917 RepID=UPI00260E2FCF|nr:serine hydrolase [uncultured Umboniibacter sp.]
MKKWLLAALVILAGSGTWYWQTIDRDVRSLILTFPTDKDLLFWSDEQRDFAFRALDKMPLLAKSRVMSASEQPLQLPAGQPLEMPLDVDAYMSTQRAAGMVIVHNGEIRFEDYRRNFTADGRWTSFSVAKSLTSTLVGAAIKDGYINSVDDKITTYLPGLEGSVYNDVTVEELLTMTSGVRWNEDYGDPNSDVAKFNNHVPEPGVDTTISYMRSLEREAPAGEKWVYKTGETNLIGLLVNRATGKTLADYLSEKIWQPYGMEADASWLLSSSGQEISGCCIQATVRDFARVGLFMLSEGKVNGESILPEGWLADATTNHVGNISPNYGYGYQWWTLDNGAFMARGIFGQGIFIDPARQLVIASNGNWAVASDRQRMEERLQFYQLIQQEIDKEIDKEMVESAPEAPALFE